LKTLGDLFINRVKKNKIKEGVLTEELIIAQSLQDSGRANKVPQSGRQSGGKDTDHHERFPQVHVLQEHIVHLQQESGKKRKENCM
jgi:hypothetical protein